MMNVVPGLCDDGDVMMMRCRVAVVVVRLLSSSEMVCGRAKTWLTGSGLVMSQFTLTHPHIFCVGIP